jgi:DNA-binding CsgD family transcriptional regulator/tetratricopeptide (TPR) repeat protein
MRLSSGGGAPGSSPELPTSAPGERPDRVGQATRSDAARYSGVRPVEAEARELRGRADECALLDQLAAGVREGSSGVLVVRGEAGIGKTALLEYLVGVAGDCRVTRTVGVESEVELAYAGLHQFCGAMMGSLSRLPGPQAEALEVAFGLRRGEAPDRFLVGLAVLGLLSEAAEEQPQLFLVDDVQWLDEVSAQTLAFVGRRLLAERVALVFAVRDRGDGGALAGLAELIVPGLAEADARALLETVVPGPVDERVRDRIVAETRGNPLALIELPRGLTPEQLAGGFGLPVSMPLASNIEQSFLQRLGPLAANTRRLLLVAAADPLGDSTLLWGAAARLGIGTDTADAAEMTGLVEIGSRVRFRHPLVRSAVYRSASAHERRIVHRALADVTDAHLDPDRHAWHRAQGLVGSDGAVAAQLERSAVRARARGGAAASAAFLERAAALTPDPGSRAQRSLAAAIAKRDAGALDAATALLDAVRRGPPDARRSAEVWRLRGLLALDQQRSGDAAQHLLRAARALESVDTQLARQTYLEALDAATWADNFDGSDVLLQIAEAALAIRPGPGPLRPVDVALDALALRVTQGFSAAAPSLIRALDVLRGQNLEAEGRWMWLTTSNVVGSIALELFESEAGYALDVAQTEVARANGALMQLRVWLHHLAHTNVLAGELAAAAVHLDESRSISAATGNPPVGYTELALEAYRGREAQASELIEKTSATARANGHGKIVSFTDYASAVLYNGIGQHDLARDAAQRVFERSVMSFKSLVIPELAEAASRTGDAALLQRALVWIRERAAGTPTSWATGIEARIGALSSTGDDADRLYRDSITRFDRTRLKAQVARGHLLYGEWLRRERRRVDARTQLGIAHEMLTGMGLEGFARRARRELMATGAAARKRSISASDELTPQENHVARLASDGLSNREIGAQLFLSPRTVEYHLRKAFTKLGIGSRLELGAVLARADEDAESA